MNEFYEVYDDDSISADKYTIYLDCKNYIRWDKNDQKSIDSLRACLSSGTPQEPQKPQEPMLPQTPQNSNNQSSIQNLSYSCSTYPTRLFEV